ncbi:hypothetical protein C8R44DRAFT_869025 [Mycena epipterygia]|nr:hypothetical protein C8R44DRAFT_869025 [Mycena epipterygia]
MRPQPPTYDTRPEIVTPAVVRSEPCSRILSAPVFVCRPACSARSSILLVHSTLGIVVPAQCDISPLAFLLGHGFERTRQWDNDELTGFFCTYPSNPTQHTFPEPPWEALSPTRCDKPAAIYAFRGSPSCQVPPATLWRQDLRNRCATVVGARLPVLVHWRKIRTRARHRTRRSHLLESQQSFPYPPSTSLRIRPFDNASAQRSSGPFCCAVLVPPAELVLRSILPQPSIQPPTPVSPLPFVSSRPPCEPSQLTLVYSSAPGIQVDCARQQPHRYPCIALPRPCCLPSPLPSPFTLLRRWLRCSLPPPDAARPLTPPVLGAETKKPTVHGEQTKKSTSEMPPTRNPRRIHLKSQRFACGGFQSVIVLPPSHPESAKFVNPKKAIDTSEPHTSTVGYSGNDAWIPASPGVIWEGQRVAGARGK